jgi:hypothetical protein
MKPVDAKTRETIDKILAYAKRNNLDEIDALNKARLIHTPALRKEEAIELLTDVYRRLEAQGAARILKHFTEKGSGTPDDMYRATLEWLELVIHNKEKEQ